MVGVKVFINNFNLLTWPRAMATKLAAQGHNVTLVDNASTYRPLLTWYERCPHNVCYLSKNYGHTGAWQAVQQKLTGAGKEDFVVTDPDLDLSLLPPDWEDVLREGLGRFPDVDKVGLALLEDRIPCENPAWELDDFKSWPAGDHPERWSEKLVTQGRWCKYYQYPVDTTFALYRAGSPYHIGGVRAGHPYAVRHLPWHIVPHDYLMPDSDPRALRIPLDDELFYYYKTANDSSTTKKRLSLMLRDYAVAKGFV